jgi:CRP-like cAMP-binding protein
LNITCGPYIAYIYAQYSLSMHTGFPHTLLDEKINSLATISPESRTLLYSHLRPLQIAKGKMLLQEEQVCKHIYFIESGLIRSYMNKDGRDINLEFSPEGYFVTHLKSLRTGCPADYGLQALETTKVWEFGKEDLQDLYTRSSEIESMGRQMVEQLLIQQEAHTHLFKIHSPTERYQHVVHHYPWLIQRVSLTQLATWLGISRETVSRIRKK